MRLVSPRRRKGQADDHRAEDEPHRRVKEIPEARHWPGGSEEYLEQADGDGSDADGHDLEDPPDPSHEKEPDGHLAGPGEGKYFTGRVLGVRQIGHHIKKKENS